MDLWSILWNGLGYELGNLVNWIIGAVEGGLAYLVWTMYKRHKEWMGEGV